MGMQPFAWFFCAKRAVRPAVILLSAWPRAGAGMEPFKNSENLALCAYIYIWHYLSIYGSKMERPSVLTMAKLSSDREMGQELVPCACSIFRVLFTSTKTSCHARMHARTHARTHTRCIRAHTHTPTREHTCTYARTRRSLRQTAQEIGNVSA